MFKISRYLTNFALMLMAVFAVGVYSACSSFEASSTFSGSTEAVTRYFVYAINNNQAGAGSISGGLLDTTTGKPTALTDSPFSTLDSPMGLAADPSGKFLFVSSDTGGIDVYAITAKTGALSRVSGSPFSAGTNPDSLVVSPNGKFLFAANAGSDNVSAYTIGTTGALSAVSGSPFAAGDGPISLAVDLNSRFLYVANNNGNSTSAYTIGTDTGVLTAMAGSPFAGSFFPRVVLVDPAGGFVYTLNEGDSNTNASSVSVYAVNSTTGVLAAVAGSPFAVQGTAFAQIHSAAFDPAGKYIYTGNWGTSKISQLTINKTTGALTEGTAVANLSNNWDVLIDPTGKYLLSLDQVNDSLTVNNITAATGVVGSKVTGSPFSVGNMPYRLVIVKTVK